MLSHKQIKTYLNYANSNSKKKKNKAKSRFNKDLKKFGNVRVNMCKEMYKEIFGK